MRRLKISPMPAIIAKMAMYHTYEVPKGSYEETIPQHHQHNNHEPKSSKVKFILPFLTVTFFCLLYERRKSKLLYERQKSKHLAITNCEDSKALYALSRCDEMLKKKAAPLDGRIKVITMSGITGSGKSAAANHYCVSRLDTAPIVWKIQVDSPPLQLWDDYCKLAAKLKI